MTRTAVTDADFYLLEQSLDDEGRQLLRWVREFMEKSVYMSINAGRPLLPLQARELS